MQTELSLPSAGPAALTLTALLAATPAQAAAPRPSKVIPQRQAEKAHKAWQRGIALSRRKQHGAAADEFQQATRLNPEDGLYWLNLANSRHHQGDHGATLEAAREAALRGQSPLLAHRLMAESLRELKRLAEALAILQGPPAGCDPDAAWLLLEGNVLFDLQRPADAVKALLGGLAAPDCGHEQRVRGMMQLGHAFSVLKRHQDAAICYRTVLDLEPTILAAALYAAHYSAWAVDWDELDRDLARLTDCIRLNHEQGRNAMGLSPFCALTLTDDAQLLRWLSELAAAPSVIPSTGKAATREARRPIERHDGRLRLGFLSSDFHHHATAILMVQMLEALDPAQFEVFLYSAGQMDRSPLRLRLEAATTVVEVGALDNRQTAERIRADRIGVLFDLKGYTMGSRMAVLAHRPAPVQVAWLGYPGTCGAPYVDYIVGDAVVTPLAHQADFTEQIAQMPVCYQPNDTSRSRPEPWSRQRCGLPGQAFVFGSFNQIYKLVPEVFAAWCRITLSREDAVLWLMVDDEATQARLRSAAAAQGLAPERLVFAPFASTEDHRARLPNLDLALDTFPCGGHTTTSDALWAGVPVLALAGQGFASRVAASLLHAVGLPELVCTDLDDYIERAITLARPGSHLADLRARLARDRDSAPLFDGQRFAADFGALILRMVARHDQGLPPAPLQACPSQG